MKQALLLSVLILGVAGIGYAASQPDYMQLSGNWKGTVVNNLKDAKGGGTPTQGEVGTPVTISFMTSPTGLSGTSTVGTNPAEQWTVQGDKYSWTDGEITVHAKRVGWDELASNYKWVLDQSKLKKGDSFFAYKFDSCTVNKDATKKCDLPGGLDKSGMWLFTVNQDKMTSDVYYTYDTGGKRILQQSLSRTTK